MYQVIFATPPLKIVKYEGGEDFTSYLEEVKFRDAPPDTYQNQPSLDTYILNQPIFSNLNKFIQKSVSEYLRDILLTETKLRITQSWINRNRKGEQHNLHTHANSILSGVFYFSDDSVPISFFSARVDQIFLSRKHDKINEFLSTTFQFPPNKNELVIFPSYIPHKVDNNTNNQPRYSLSFNTFAEGEIGEPFRLTHVKF